MTTKLRTKDVILVLLAILVLICISKPASAIEGGETAFGENVSAIIFVDASGKPIFNDCTAVVVAPRLAVTAKHCLTSTSPLFSDPGAPVNFPLRIAEPGIDLKESVSSSLILKVVTTPGDFQAYEDDISILILKSEVVTPTTIRIATREDLARLSQSGATVITYGYGTDSKGKNDGLPKKIRSRLMGVEKDSRAWKASVPSATYRHCAQDSGGPSYAIEDGVMFYLGPLSASNAPGCMHNQYIPNNPYVYGGSSLGHFSHLLAEAEAELASILKKELADQAAESAKATPTSRVTVRTPTKSIVCRQGLTRRIVTAVKPKCPLGFRLVR